MPLEQGQTQRPQPLGLSPFKLRRAAVLDATQHTATAYGRRMASERLSVRWLHRARCGAIVSHSIQLVAKNAFSGVLDEDPNMPLGTFVVRIDGQEFAVDWLPCGGEREMRLRAAAIIRENCPDSTFDAMAAPFVREKR